MFWGAFGLNGKSKLVEIPTRLDSIGYQGILKDNLLPSARSLAKRSWIFQQENASIHA
jgi:hypothetical protein